jgi:hypothetical protein
MSGMISPFTAIAASRDTLCHDGRMWLQWRDVDAFEPGVQVGHQQTALGQRLRRREPATFKPLIPEREAGTVPIQDLNLAPVAPDEDEQVTWLTCLC